MFCVVLKKILTAAILLTITLFVSVESNAHYKTVETNSGRIRGVHDVTLRQNHSYYSFRGIPYAKKPIGQRRFKAPEPIEPWSDVLDAFAYPNSCLQQSWALGNSGEESEDCLYLNVFVPVRKEPTMKFAVMFFIHGGGFAEGSGNNYYNGPDFLLERDVIVVTINYRLGAFGFMSLGLPDHSGNMGLKDQQLALKWISVNIHAFGGDCEQITVFGQSAGAVSTHYHVLSKYSRTLFKRAICISGSAFLFYSYLDVNNHLDKMYAFVKQMNVTVNNLSELKVFLHDVDAKKIVEFTSQKSVERTLEFDWAPVIEDENDFQPFLLAPPEQIYETDDKPIDVDMIFGYTNNECAPLIWNDILNPDRLTTFLNEFHLKLPIHNFHPSDDSECYERKLNQVHDHYFGNGTTEKDRKVQYVNLISDMNMVYPIDKAAKMHATHSATFYYEFAVDAKLNVMKQMQDIDMPGASHGDDLCYLFRCRMIDSHYDKILNERNRTIGDEITLHTIDRITTLFTNFAKNGNPSNHDELVQNFESIQNHEIHFVHISNNGLSTGLSPKKQSNQFWAHISQTKCKPKRD